MEVKIWKEKEKVFFNERMEDMKEDTLKSIKIIKLFMDMYMQVLIMNVRKKELY